MSFLIRLLFLCCFSFSLIQCVQAQTIIRSVQIEGLHVLSPATVLSYVPARAGQPFSSVQSAQLIQTLYATGFFDDVSIIQQRSILLIHVRERPVISRLKVLGNKAIPQDKMDELLKRLDLVAGQFYDVSVLHQFISELKTQYINSGNYSAKIISTVTPQARHRVAIALTISEGDVAQITQIHITGNRAFSEKVLLKALPIAPHHLWSFLTGSDKYNQAKLQAAQDSLRNYYLDHGYLKFQILSNRMDFTPDSDHVHVLLQISEGSRYTLENYRIVGELHGIDLKKLVKLKSKKIYSRADLVDTERAIQNALANQGYAFSSINVDTNVDEQDKTVSLILNVSAGRKIYVRYILINGNIKTQDEVFRRLLVQQEGSMLSAQSMQESLRQLSFSQLVDANPDVTPIPVANTLDQVDLSLNLKEAHAAQALFSLGYGTNGALFGASLNQNNVFGTGNNLLINFTDTRAMTQYGISYTNPYYTLDGVSRGFDLYYMNSSPEDVNTTLYSSNSYGGILRYNIPLDAKGDSLFLSAGAQRLLLKLPDVSLQSLEVQKFVSEHGTKFNQLLFTVGWGRNTLDRLLFPTRGLNQGVNLNLNLPAGGRALEYYKIGYSGTAYYPLFYGFIGQAHIALGYGAGFGSSASLPFFANYYAGGVGALYDGQVRGYEASTIGPKDTLGYPLGGNILTAGSIALFLPHPISTDTVRVSLFIDGGNVYSSMGQTRFNNPAGGTSSGPIRYSTGVAVDWRLPVLNVTLSLSLAKAINPQPQDQTQVFQFNLGTVGF